MELDGFDGIITSLGESPAWAQLPLSPIDTSPWEHLLTPESFTTGVSLEANESPASHWSRPETSSQTSPRALVPAVDWGTAEAAALFTDFGKDDMELYDLEALIASKEPEVESPKAKRKGKRDGAGPNRYGRAGTKRCGLCRRWRRKVIPVIQS
jgi:hypothetical protein